MKFIHCDKIAPPKFTILSLINTFLVSPYSICSFHVHRALFHVHRAPHRISASRLQLSHFDSILIVHPHPTPHSAASILSFFSASRLPLPFSPHTIVSAPRPRLFLLTYLGFRLYSWLPSQYVQPYLPTDRPTYLSTYGFSMLLALAHSTPHPGTTVRSLFSPL